MTITRWVAIDYCQAGTSCDSYGFIYEPHAIISTRSLEYAVDLKESLFALNL